MMNLKINPVGMGVNGLPQCLQVVLRFGNLCWKFALKPVLFQNWGGGGGSLNNESYTINPKS